MQAGTPDLRRGERRIRTGAIIATAVLLIGGFTVALMPALVFHSGLASLYGQYPQVGMIISLLSLIPANVWAVSGLRSRMGTPLLVVLLLVLTAIAGGMLYLAFVVIYLSTIDWFVF
ncbi:MAG: hypothetical protein ABIP33_04730 [Pseudolysinimonas sp.]